MTITLNPGFCILIGAGLALILPRALRAPAMVAAALGAVILMFEPNFGAGPAFAQIGLVITPARLDPLSQVFGLGFALATAILALFSFQRDNKLEDVALMAHAGAATTAAFAGDLVSFVAAAQFSAFAGAILVFAGPGPDARGAGVRLATWQFIAGALLAAGVGLEWAATGRIDFGRMNAEGPAGALTLAGALIMVGAPLAHVWVKDALPQTSALGGAALAVFTLKLGAYALARAFPGEPLLIYLGAVMAIGALPLAALAGDLRQSAAYGLISQSGAAIAAIGGGTPLALAGAAALSFAGMFQGLLALLTIGLACERAGSARAGGLGGLARAMPVTASLAIIAALSTLATPGFAGFTAGAILSDAVAHEERPILWLALTAAGAGGVLHMGARIPLAAFFGPDRGLGVRDAPFAGQLAMGLAAFFCVAVGVAPGWLYALLPEQIYFHPYDWDHLVRQGELIAFGGLALALVQTARLYPSDRGGETLDLDWFLRRPGRAALVRLGRACLALYDLGRAGFDWVYAFGGRLAAALATEGDRPAAPDAAGLVWALVVLTVTMSFLFAFQG